MDFIFKQGQLHNNQEGYNKMNSDNGQTKFPEQKKLKVAYFVSILSLIFCFVLLVITIVVLSKISDSSRDIEQTEKIQSVVNNTRFAQYEIDDTKKDIMMILQRYEKLHNKTESLKEQLDNNSDETNLLRNRLQLNDDNITLLLQNYRQVQNETHSLDGKVQNNMLYANNLLHRITSNQHAIYRQYKRMSTGWIALFNGYQYKKTTRHQSWQQTRRICKSWGGDLVVYGMQSMESRRLLIDKLLVFEDVYIGLKRSGNGWAWVNGDNAIPSAIFWSRGEPSNGTVVENCVHVRKSLGSNRNYGLGSQNVKCSVRNIGVCEKRVVKYF